MIATLQLLRGLTGDELYMAAWRATYLERGLPLPKKVSRSGFWGRLIGDKTKHPLLTWHEPQKTVPGMFTMSELGLQQVGPESARVQILILGGSVAWGAAASSEDRSYFTQLQRRLVTYDIVSRVSVLACGGWVSSQEFIALTLKGMSLAPDVVVFFDGLNDLTQLNWLPHEERGRYYLETMALAKRTLAKQRPSAKVVYALQPLSLRKRYKTPVERVALERYPDHAAILQQYLRLQKGLGELANENAYLVDLADVLGDERASTFTDIWHFTEPGEDIVATTLADALAVILTQRMRAGARPAIPERHLDPAARAQ